MKRIKRYIAVFALALGFLVMPFIHSYAEAPQKENKIGSSEFAEYYSFEKPHTQIIFSVDHLGFSVSSGRFTSFEGGFQLDRDNLENSSIDITIAANSVYMGDTEWEEHLKSADFLSAELHPDIRFASTKVELLSEEKANVYGMLSIAGVEKEVVLKVTHNKSAFHPFNGKYMAGFTAETTIKRSDFGMTYGLPLLADDVHIKIAVEGIRDESASNNENN